MAREGEARKQFVPNHGLMQIGHFQKKQPRFNNNHAFPSKRSFGTRREPIFCRRLPSLSEIRGLFLALLVQGGAGLTVPNSLSGELVFFRPVLLDIRLEINMEVPEHSEVRFSNRKIEVLISISSFQGGNRGLDASKDARLSNF